MDRTRSIAQYLRGVQDHAVKMIAHKQFGLRQISKTTPEAKDACDFSSLLVIQPVGGLEPNADVKDPALIPVDLARLTSESDAAFQDYFNYPLVTQGRIYADRVELLLVYDSMLLQDAQMGAPSAHFNHVVQQLLTQDETPGSLGNVSVSGPWDSEKVLSWNTCPPKLVNTCIQDLVPMQAAEHPDRQAISAWDRSATYDDLETMSTVFAKHLVRNGVRPETMVPVCFEKTFWAAVAMLDV
ncbi:nonribosomal peptide synthase nlsA [Colletotrichum liriopes]|uniref:Nonribosomal peptide synthase nlsA n=1 Tax=Colletotrichum liriopes TaxID=708192 RepID=A0AA37H0X4_9PEZI|nr:nonribosomal peptide synthase nlsA [Colletotrichum liriopes]